MRSATTTASSKTQLIMQIVRQIRDRGDVAVVYDPAGEFVERFYDEKRGDYILNPLDDRCPFWGPASEMERNQEATAIAASLYQPTSTSTKDEFFYRAPAKIFAHAAFMGANQFMIELSIARQNRCDHLGLGERVRACDSIVTLPP
jgi:Type IV secretion-system coupling protein DNA-binding domain